VHVARHPLTLPLTQGLPLLFPLTAMTLRALEGKLVRDSKRKAVPLWQWLLEPSMRQQAA